MTLLYHKLDRCFITYIQEEGTATPYYSRLNLAKGHLSLLKFCLSKNLP
jgi:hypothetical protein